MTGAISYGLARRQRVMPPVADNEQSDEEEDANGILPPHPNRAATTPKKRKLSEFSLGIIEAVMLLAGIDLLFAAFVAIQFTYFFGGRENIFNVEGYTFAEYAHRGFAELIIVSLLTLALMLILDRVTIRRQHNHHHIFRALVVFMVAMMAIMLLSASQRMSVYEEAYGFTHLRVYVHAFIFWLGMLFIAFTLEMFRLKINVFSLGVLLVIIGYLITLNLMNIDSYIAHRNMNRLLNNNKQLDVCYLQTLSMDAVPAMIKIRENIDDEDTLDSINRWLNMQLHQLNDIRHNDTFFSYNWSRDRAWNALQPLQNELSYYSTYLGSCSTYVPQGYVP